MSTVQTAALGENENSINENELENELIDKIEVVIKKEKIIKKGNKTNKKNICHNIIKHLNKKFTKIHSCKYSYNKDNQNYKNKSAYLKNILTKIIIILISYLFNNWAGF